MLDLVIPATCLACGAAGRGVCDACVAALQPAPPLDTPSGLERCLALVAYEGTGRALVTGLKYRNRRAGLRVVARAMAALVPPGSVQTVTWAPTTPCRRRQRGFDQAELLARCVAGVLALPVGALLERPAGPAQTGLTSTQRHLGPVFRPRARARSARRVLLIDDVVTTGTTLSVAAAALRSVGIRSVTGLTLAATPLKVTTRSADNREREGGTIRGCDATDRTPGSAVP